MFIVYVRVLNLRPADRMHHTEATATPAPQRQKYCDTSHDMIKFDTRNLDKKKKVAFIKRQINSSN